VSAEDEPLCTSPSHQVLGKPDHHLWNNHGTWWCHYTVHLPDYTKRRVRLSLGTPSVEQARKLRDRLLQAKPTSGLSVKAER
jgi:hypothetical protein